MGPGPDTSDGVSRREPFGAGWTGALTVGLLVYILFAIVMIFVGRHGRTGLRGLQSVLRCACVHRRGDTGRSGRTPRDVAGRPAHLVVPHGGDRRLHPRQPAELDLLAVRRRPLPVVRRRLLPRLLPAAVRRHPDRNSRRGRARAMGTPRARRDDPDAGLRRVLLVLRDRTDCSRRTRSRRRQVRPDAELHRAQLPHAARLRRPADARRRRPDRTVAH